jgi:murein L,D-transpeptidase YcbB/YkuD
VEGVRRFQIRHGLEPDGILGKGTQAALRVPLTWRVRQIELALERLRWLPDLGDERLLAINIPMFRLWAWDLTPPNDAPSLAMDVIVGRALSTQTPVFDEEMREVIFRPYWNVPRSILRNEILPLLERDPDYLRRQNMEIVRGAGDNAQPVQATAENLVLLRKGALRLRQRPGPNNALGLVKFVFPNEENVYMHGTPAQALFSRSRRDFSHGCVRVEDPVALAEWALKERPEWTRDRIVSAMAGTQSFHVSLPRPIQVILFYTTAVVMPEDGTIHFADDIYRHDARLDRVLARPNASQ